MISPHRIMPASHTRQWWLAGGIHPSQVVAAYDFKSTPTVQQRCVNVANPGTYNCTVYGSAPDLLTSGFRFTGTSRWLSTGVIPQSSGFSFFVSFPIFSAGGTLLGINQSTSQRFFIVPNLAPNARFFYANGDVTVSGAATLAGVLGISDQKIFKNGTNIANIPNTFTAPSLPMLIGARSTGESTADGFMSGVVASVVFYNSVLSDAQVAALSAAMAAL